MDGQIPEYQDDGRSKTIQTIISIPNHHIDPGNPGSVDSDSVGAVLNAGRQQAGCWDLCRLASLVTGWPSRQREIPAGFRLGSGSRLGITTWFFQFLADSIRGFPESVDDPDGNPWLNPWISGSD